MALKSRVFSGQSGWLQKLGFQLTPNLHNDLMSFQESDLNSHCLITIVSAAGKTHNHKDSFSEENHEAIAISL